MGRGRGAALRSKYFTQRKKILGEWRAAYLQFMAGFKVLVGIISGAIFFTCSIL